MVELDICISTSVAVSYAEHTQMYRWLICSWAGIPGNDESQSHTKINVLTYATSGNRNAADDSCNSCFENQLIEG